MHSSFLLGSVVTWSQTHYFRSFLIRYLPLILLCKIIIVLFSRSLILSLILFDRLLSYYRDTEGSRMMVLHISHQFLSSKLVLLNYLVDLVLETGFISLKIGSLNNLWINFYFFFMNVLLESSEIIISVIKIIVECNPLVFLLLFLYIFFCLLHVTKHSLQLLLLFIFFRLNLFALNIFTNYIL
jgi:hypothetical protein